MKPRSLKYSLGLVILLILFSCSLGEESYYTDLPDEILELRIKELHGARKQLLLPSSSDLENIPADPGNPLTKDKVLLGQLLFHETGFGLAPEMEIGKETYSCASCHHFKAGFQSGIIQGIGEGGVGFGIKGESRHASSDYPEELLDVQPIKTPSALNVAFQEVMLWNGQFGALGINQGTEGSWTSGTPKENNHLGFSGVETQAIAALTVHRQVIESDLVFNKTYKKLFDKAFPEIPQDKRYTKITAGLAIAAYERTLLPNEAPFQKWLKGNKNAMSTVEKEGALLFYTKGKCYTCHSGPGMNGMGFHALGMKDLQGANVHKPIDEITKKGRGGFTLDPEDDFKFKTPQLYNLKDVQFYGHGGSFRTLREIIEYKNKAVPENAAVPVDNLSPLFEPLDLTDSEIDKLTYFIENSLYDDRLSRFVPESLPSGNCFPNADPQSMEDLGCIDQ
ncbi:cytochrome c peroxidase [Pontixanthobacter gangjinensis]|uniref:Cytochrome-c peroxidase n=1 Tax=Christiangramia aestuarii TaxID=1028746 RepID=A0A7K1LMX4_9FLAO|nr:cytochrome c peroxidase [Christiangramia aestuarii]MUP42156.1 cytochrome-c peroxidase [Christiangramia aestuarii]